MCHVLDRLEMFHSPHTQYNGFIRGFPRIGRGEIPCFKSVNLHSVALSYCDFSAHHNTTVLYYHCTTTINSTVLPTFPSLLSINTSSYMEGTMGSRFIEVEKVCNLMCISNKEGHGVISKRCDNFFVMCGWGEGEIFFNPPF